MIASRGKAAAVAALVLVAGAGCGAQPNPKAAKKAKPPEPPPLQLEQPLEVRPIEEMTLAPGEEKSAVVVVDRHGNAGAITAQVTELPPGITAAVKPATEADGSATIEITVAADATLGDADVERQAQVQVAVGDKTTARAWNLRVPRVGRPEVSPQPPFMIQPGTKTTWRVPIDRHGFAERIDFRAAASPPTALAVKAAAAPERQAEALLQIAVPADAPDGDVSCTLEWTAYGRAMSAELPVRIVRAPFAIPVAVPVTLRPGEAREMRLAVERTGYPGPVSLTLGQLPAGVRASPPGLTVAADSAAITISAEASAAEGVAIVPVRASAGHLAAVGVVTVRVLGETPRESLPAAALAALPERARRGGVAARRGPEVRAALAGWYGSTEESGLAVRRALGWLAAQQADSGAWQPTAEAARPGAADPVALTALTVLSFLGEGVTYKPGSASTPDMERYPDAVRKALVFLSAAQPEGGDTAGAIGTTMDTHLLGLVAFSEAYGLSDNDELKSRAKRGADRLIRFQGKGGDWAQTRGQTARDTAFATVALQAARSCGVSVPGGVFRKAVKNLEIYRTIDPPPNSRFAASPSHPADPELTALCLLAMLGEGRELAAPEIVAGCDFLAGFAPAVGAARTDLEPLFFVVAGEALRTVEGERYDAWNAAVRSFLTERQVRDGELAGSWDPAIFGGTADRVWTTACAVLCLQSHFRLLPLSRR